MLTENLLHKAVKLLVEAAAPRKIILFGSYAEGRAGEESDFDFVVLEDTVANRRSETVRLLRALEPHEIPADILVASTGFYEQWKDVPGTVLFEAARRGRIVYEAA